MQSFWYYAYNVLGVPPMIGGACIASWFNEKIRKSLRGRRNLFPLLEVAMTGMDGRPRFWIHNSSMGEFEQAKPVIRGLKEAYPEGSVIVTFFSPSGFDHARNFPYADHVAYLPLDSRRRARRFVRTLRPDAAVFVRHDLWPNHLREAQRAGIPRILINCSLPALTRPAGAPFFFVKRFVYDYFNLILTVSERSRAFCESRSLGERVAAVGDTRFDQAVRRAEQAESEIASLRSVVRGRRVLVAGSTWPEDEDLLIRALDDLKENVKMWLVLVPHEPTEEHLGRVERTLNAAGFSHRRLSAPDSREESSDVLLVDRVGILAGLYALGDVTYVGGGFTSGVHNVLEPAALGKVVLYGPRHTNSHEAVLLKERGVGHVVRDSGGALALLSSFFEDSEIPRNLGRTAAELVLENVGATGRIVEQLSRMIAS